MAGAYNVFANQGVYVKPRMVRKIVDQTDRVLEESSLVERRGLDVVTLTRQRENSRESSG